MLLRGVLNSPRVISTPINRVSAGYLYGADVQILNKITGKRATPQIQQEMKIPQLEQSRAKNDYILTHLNKDKRVGVTHKNG